MELFDLPLEYCTHLSSIIKFIAKEHGYSYTKYKRHVHALLSTTDLGKVWTRKRRVFRVLRDYGKADQRSSAWLQKRSEMITASEITKAFKTASPSARYELLTSKINPKDQSTGMGITACTWGTQFEPLIKDIYGNIRNADVIDTTCVRHPKYSFLGASPDGIVLTKDVLDGQWGKLVEFKCPISRQFSQETPIPEYYYHQMQMQMECTGIDECDYVEAQFKTCTKTQYNKSATEYKGMFAVYDDGTLDYKPTHVEFREWKNTLHGDEYRIIYWTLEKLSVKVVKRDFNWMNDHLEELQECWNIIQECRKDPSKMEQYAPQTARRDVPSESLLVDVQSLEPEVDSSSGRTMKLRLTE
jgi:putative phage-type endonuclease